MNQRELGPVGGKGRGDLISPMKTVQPGFLDMALRIWVGQPAARAAGGRGEARLRAAASEKQARRVQPGGNGTRREGGEGEAHGARGIRWQSAHGGAAWWCYLFVGDDSTAGLLPTPRGDGFGPVAGWRGQEVGPVASVRGEGWARHVWCRLQSVLIFCGGCFCGVWGGGGGGRECRRVDAVRWGTDGCDVEGWSKESWSLALHRCVNRVAFRFGTRDTGIQRRRQGRGSREVGKTGDDRKRIKRRTETAQ